MAAAGRDPRLVSRGGADETALPNRRLDSLARIITGTDTCSAIAFYDNKLYVANNNNNTSELLEDTLRLLSDIAREDPKISIDELVFEGGKYLDRIEKIGSKSVLESLKSTQQKRFGQERKIKESLSNSVRLSKDLTKVLASMTSDAAEGLPDGVVEALKLGLDGDGIEFLMGDPKGKHAEMILVEKITDIIDEKDEAAINSVYMGISKLCCWECKCAVEAVNKKYKSDDGRDLFEARGTHNKTYGSWIEPTFFDKADVDEITIRAHYEKLLSMTRGGRSRDRAPSSSSPPDERMLAALAAKMTEGATLTAGEGPTKPDPSPSGKSAAASSGKAH